MSEHRSGTYLWINKNPASTLLSRCEGLEARKVKKFVQAGSSAPQKKQALRIRQYRPAGHVNAKHTSDGIRQRPRQILPQATDTRRRIESDGGRARTSLASLQLEAKADVESASHPDAASSFTNLPNTEFDASPADPSEYTICRLGRDWSDLSQACPIALDLPTQNLLHRCKSYWLN